MTQEQEVLQIVKLRLGVPDESQDTLINSYIKEISRRILHYCQRNDIPPDLNWVWASMVIDLLKIAHPDKYGSDADGMTVKIGDTSVGPAKSSGLAINNAMAQIVLNYMADLHRWRKMRW